MATVKEVEKKLGPLAQLHELSQSTEERLDRAQRARRARLAQGQGAREPAAGRRACRRPGQPRQRDGLGDGRPDRQAERGHEAGGEGRGDDRPHREARRRTRTRSSRRAAKLRQEAERETRQADEGSDALLDAVRAPGRHARAQEEGVRGVRRAAARAADLGRRRRIAHGGARREGQEPRSSSTQKVDGLTKRFETLFAQADELTKKQLVARGAARAARRRSTTSPRRRRGRWTRCEQSRQDLDVLRKEIQDFYKSHAEIAKLRDKLGADRLALEAFGERMTAFAARAPELEAQDGRHPRQAEAGRGGHAEGDAAARIGGRARRADLARQRARAVRREARRPPERPERAQRRRRPEARRAARAARRARDAARRACDGLGAQMVDAQHKLEVGARAPGQRWCRWSPSVNAAQGRNRDRDTSGLDGVKFDEATIAEQEKRFAELVAASTAVGDRSRRAHAADAGARPRSWRGRRRSRTSCSPSSIASRAGSATRSARSRRPRISWRAPRTMFKQLEQRRAQVAFGEKKLAAVESRLAEIKQIADRARQEHRRRSPAASSWSTRSRPKSRPSTRSARAARPTSRTSPSTAAEVADAQEPRRRAAVAHRRNRRAHRSHRRAPQAGRRSADQGQRHRPPARRRADQPRDAGRAEGGRRPRRREGRAARVHAAGGAQHAAHAAARARAGRADRAGHQAAAVQDGAVRGRERRTA